MTISVSKGKKSETSIRHNNRSIEKDFDFDKNLAEVKDETVSDLFLNALQYQAEHQLKEIKQKR